MYQNYYWDTMVPKYLHYSTVSVIQTTTILHECLDQERKLLGENFWNILLYMRYETKTQIIKHIGLFLQDAAFLPQEEKIRIDISYVISYERPKNFRKCFQNEKSVSKKLFIHLFTLTFLYTCVLVFYMGSLSQENKYTTRGSARRFLFLSF